jgi:NADPH:quinone reductase-like Zn-dependent oxidoreductase
MPTLSSRTDTARAVVLTGFDEAHLRLVERRPREPGPGEAMVRIRAASLNFRDHLVISGLYGIGQDALPFVPVSDGAGEVIAVGDDVRSLVVGDRVTTMMTRDWIAGALTPERHAAQNGGPLDGALTEIVTLPERALVRFPDDLEFAEAATLPIAALTAWNALHEGGLAPGQTMLAIGSGGVSLFALQLAKAFGARAIVTTGQPERRGAQLHALGADAVIDYRDENWPEAVVAANGGAGVDLVVECGGLQTLGGSLHALRQGGFIAFVGMVAGLGRDVADFTLPLLLKNARLRGMITGNRDSYEALLRAMTVHRLRPVIDRRFPLEQFRDAFAHLREGRPFGKIVIELD